MTKLRDDIQKKLDAKRKTYYGVKNASIEIADIDTGSRQVKGYLSVFDVIDSDEDIIRRGAFAKSIAEIGPSSSGNRKIQHLRNHNWDWQIGKFTELAEDEKGLYFVSTLGTSSKGDDALRDYDEGILLEHSIGFNYVWDKMDWIDDDKYDHGGFFEVREVKLWEGLRS